jgi:hypothetical protein
LNWGGKYTVGCFAIPNLFSTFFSKAENSSETFDYRTFEVA